MNEDSISVSAPGSLVLFGEHAVNYGEPAVALSVKNRSVCNARVSSRFAVNDEELVQTKHPHIRGALLQGWTDMDTPISFTTETSIPSSWNLAVSSMTVACLGSLSMLHDHVILEEVARKAFEVEFDLLGKIVNPLDPITSTYGSAIVMDKQPSDNFLWKVEKGQKTWYAHHQEVPDIQFVLGNTGTPSPTRQMVEKVMRFYERNAFARDIIKDIGQTSLEGADALKKGDVEKLGRMMNANQKLLLTLGVSHSMLEKLISAAARHSYGTKLTGMGGGGCILALTDTPEKVCKAIEQVGGQPHLLSLDNEGLRIEDD
jgi:mevalonate kinase